MQGPKLGRISQAIYMPEPHLLGIIISYSHSHYDAESKDRLLTHLAALEAVAPVKIWTDAEIPAGRDWELAIDQALNAAVAALLLVSPDYLASSFVRSKEVPLILARHQNDGLIVFPILLRPCVWKLVPWLHRMQMLPKDAEPAWREDGRYADGEFAFIVQKLWSDIAAQKALRTAAQRNEVRACIERKQASLQAELNQAREDWLAARSSVGEEWFTRNLEGQAIRLHSPETLDAITRNSAALKGKLADINRGFEDLLNS